MPSFGTLRMIFVFASATGRSTNAFVDLAGAVYVMNDGRARLKREINVHLGSAIVEEKSYAPMSKSA